MGGAGGGQERGAARAAVALTLCLGVVSVLPVTVGPASAEATCRAGYVALTFDDGPIAEHTPAVLDVLVARQVPATFFVVGWRVASRPQLVARMAREGHRVANHTYDHDRLTSLGAAAIRRTVDRTDGAIRAAGAAPLRLVRPPGGRTNASVRAALSAAGYGHILWDVDPQDWRSSATASSVRRFVLDEIHPGAVVLLHDGNANSPATIAALPGIITGVRDRGFCFATLDDRGRLVPAELDWRDRGGVYRDVPPDSTHGPAIARLHALGIARGCGDERYCPDRPVTRAQVASFLQRALGLPPGRDDRFRDVAPGSPHAAAIGALLEAGITAGCSTDGRRFCPEEPIPRDQMASLLQRALVLPAGPPDRFRDVPPSSPHAAAIGAVHEVGITRGCTSDGRSYCPAARIDRAQMASMLVRALDHRAR